MAKVIVDIGSCHNAKLEYCKEAIDLAVEVGAWAIKFQLFKDLPPNIELPREYWPELVEYAKDRIIIFASVFDTEAEDLLIRHKSEYVKLAFSQRCTFSLEYMGPIKNCFVSCLPSEVSRYKNFIKLFCIPEYPVTHYIDFNILRRYDFQGFSDHTVGWWQTMSAIHNGAEYIEKHITLDHDDINVPDAQFALRPDELRRMMNEIKTVNIQRW